MLSFASGGCKMPGGGGGAVNNSNCNMVAVGGGSREKGNASEGPYGGSCWYTLPLSAFHLFKGAAKTTALTSVL